MKCPQPQSDLTGRGRLRLRSVPAARASGAPPSFTGEGAGGPPTKKCSSQPGLVGLLPRALCFPPWDTCFLNARRTAQSPLPHFCWGLTLGFPLRRSALFLSARCSLCPPGTHGLSASRCRLQRGREKLVQTPGKRLRPPVCP